MSKTITVPDIGAYPIHLRVNQTDYTLTPGSTATVPDEVAALLAQIVAAKPAPDPDGWKDAAATLGDIDSAVELPVVSSTDNGKLLGVSSGKWAKVDAPTELPAVSGTDNGNVLTVVEGAWTKAAPPTGLPAVSGSDNSKVLTVTDGAWAARYPAVERRSLSGTIDLSTGIATIADVTAEQLYNYASNCILRTTLSYGTGSVDTVMFLTSQSNGGGSYDFAFLGADGTRYATGHLNADDAVVFSPVT